MTILQAGFPKSGNLWLYKIIKSSIQHSGQPYRQFMTSQPVYQQVKDLTLSYDEQASTDVLDIDPDGCFYRVSTIFREPVTDIESYMSQCSHAWTHSDLHPQGLEVLPLFDKVVYIIRDPRDVAISLSKFAFTPYAQQYLHLARRQRDPDSYLQSTLESNARNWVRNVGSYLRSKDHLNIHVVFYERMLYHFDEEFRHLLDYLELSLSQDAREAIKHQVSFTTMHQSNPNHVRQGKSGNWKQKLTSPQQQQVLNVAGSMLSLLHYPCGSQESTALELPSLPPQLDQQEIEQAMAQARKMTLRRIMHYGAEVVSHPQALGLYLKRLQKFLINLSNRA